MNCPAQDTWALDRFATLFLKSATTDANSARKNSGAYGIGCTRSPASHDTRHTTHGKHGTRGRQ